MHTTLHKELLFIGLGNPGKKYEETRHNLGFLVINFLADKWEWSFKKDSRLECYASRGLINEKKVHLIMPTTYMNESGRTVNKYCDYFKIKPEQILVITDDVALNYGNIRLKEKGSSGGHNGLKSIENYLGTNQYPRLRIGIDGPKFSQELENYVLSRFSTSEFQELPNILERSVSILTLLLSKDIQSVMNTVNVKQGNNAYE